MMKAETARNLSREALLKRAELEREGQPQNGEELLKKELKENLKRIRTPEEAMLLATGAGERKAFLESHLMFVAGEKRTTKDLKESGQDLVTKYEILGYRVGIALVLSW